MINSKSDNFSNLKVALVHDFIMQVGGAEKVLKALSEIFPDAPIFTIISDQRITDTLLPNKKIISSYIGKLPFANKKYKIYLPLMPKAIESFNFDNFDLVISDSSAFAKGIITGKKTKHICYLHTPTRYLWDIPDYYIKTSLPVFIRPFAKMIFPYLKRWDISASKRPDRLIVNSKTIWKRTLLHYHRKPDALIYPFADVNYTKGKNGSYFLLTGRLVPYKRFDIVINAFNKLELPLHVVGDGYDRDHLEKINQNSKTKFFGRVNDKELYSQYANCKAYIFPALEDFGITPIEAMQFGKPVIAYNKGGVTETVNRKTGIFFNNQTEDAIIKAVSDFGKLRFDERKIRAHGLKFSKERFKNEVVQFLDKTITKTK